ncbi:MAG TPA: chorismate mutase [Bacteroidota bacterium]
MVRQIGELKKRRGRQVFDKKREREIMRKQSAVARDLGLDEAFVGDLFRAVMHLAKTTQKEGRTGGRR